MDHVKRGVKRADDVRDNRWRLPLSNSMDRLLTFVLFSSSSAKSLGAKIDEDRTEKVHGNLGGCARRRRQWQTRRRLVCIAAGRSRGFSRVSARNSSHARSNTAP